MKKCLNYESNCDMKITMKRLRRMWDFADRNTYDDKAPRFSAARDNENWGHCELDFIDTKTAKVLSKLMCLYE